MDIGEEEPPVQVEPLSIPDPTPEPVREPDREPVPA